MVAIALAYATRDGQTRRIAGRIASTLERRGHVVDAFDVVASPPTNLDIARYDAAIVASSVRIGKHAERQDIGSSRKIANLVGCQAIPATDSIHVDIK